MTSAPLALHGRMGQDVPMSYGLLQRWRASTRSAVVAQAPPPWPMHPLRVTDIAAGWEVRDSLGRLIGRVKASRDEGLVVSRNFRRSLLVPLRAIGEVRPGIVTVIGIGETVDNYGPPAR